MGSELYSPDNPLKAPITLEEVKLWKLYCKELEKDLKTLENIELIIWGRMIELEINKRKEKRIM